MQANLSLWRASSGGDNGDRSVLSGVHDANEKKKREIKRRKKNGFD